MKPRPTATGRWLLVGIDTVTQMQFGQRWFPQPYVMPNGDWVITFCWNDDAAFAKGGLLRSSDRGKTWREQGWATDSGVLIHLGGDEYGIFDSYYSVHKGGDEFAIQAVFSSDGGRTFGPVNMHIPLHCSGAQLFSLAAMMSNYFTLPCYPWNRFFKANGYPMTVPGWPQTAEQIIFGAGGPSNHTVQLDDGRLISMNFTRGNKPPGVNTVDYWFAYALESTDRGRSWHQVGIVPWSPKFRGEEAMFSFTGFTEAGVTKLDDGELLIVLRAGSHVPLGMCRSRDAGRNWSEPEFIHLHNINAPANGILPTLRRTHDAGNGVACIYGRPGVHLITDATGTGRHWEHEIDFIEVERELCRANGAPDDFFSTENAGMTELSPGELAITYELTGWTESREKEWVRQTIRMARLKATDQ